MAYQYGSSSYAYLDPLSAKTYREVFTGYAMGARNIGASTSVQTANQLAEVDARLKEGVSTIEMGTMQPELFEQIPKQQFDEMRRLAKLANAEVTVHAPLIDPSGFSQEGGWSEQNRQHAEGLMLETIRKSHELNPKGNVPITFHASTIGAEDWSTKLDYKPGDELHPQEMLVVVNPETGRVNAFKKEVMYFPWKKEAETRSPIERLDSVNATEWQDHLIQIQNMVKTADEIMERAPKEAQIYLEGLRSGKIEPEQLTEDKRKIIQQYQETLSRAKLYQQDAQTRFRTLYEWAVKYKPKPEGKTEEEQKSIERLGNATKAISRDWIGFTEGVKELEKKEEPIDLTMHYKAERALLLDSVNKLSDRSIATPELNMPVTEFALTQAPNTIATVALKAYKQFGETTPIIAVENIAPNMVFSRADTLIDLVKKSRNEFVTKAVASGIKEEKARKEAEKLIGATWDIAHINLLRSKGFTEKEIVEETKKIAPYVKKVHIADNFGMEHSDLPPGMGTAPIKQMLEQIEKAGFKGKSIVECGSFVGQFKTSPVPYMFEALGAPIYTAQGGPMWGQAAGMYAESPMSYGVMFPEQHFSMYGAGFSTLPTSLGGQVPGKQSRFSGAPME
jgi:sugar phosphate isomerase/epimerase